MAWMLSKQAVHSTHGLIRWCTGPGLSADLGFRDRTPLRGLPINKLSLLQHLELFSLEVVLPANDDGSAAQTGLLGRLQHLDLKVVHLEDVGSLEQLTSSSNLTCLALESLVIAGWHFNPEMYELCIGGRQYKDSYSWPESDEQCETVEWVVQAVPGILQRLPRLSVLRPPGIAVTNAAVWQLEALQGLRGVTMHHTGDDSTLDLHHLPGSLTGLCFYGQLKWHPEHPTELPQRAPPNLSMLQSLSLSYCDVPPTLLGGVTPQLLELRLKGCVLLPYDDEYVEAPMPEGTAALLDTLPRSTNLLDLELTTTQLDTKNIAAERFSSLTSSSNLTRLLLYDGDEQPAPRDAMAHMFPAGRQLPALQMLVIEPDMFTRLDAFCLDTAGLADIITACPRLNSLNIARAFEPGTDLSPLLQLPSCCTFLSIGKERNKPAAASIVAQLTQLKPLV